jgi:hypothetical protein
MSIFSENISNKTSVEEMFEEIKKHIHAQMAIWINDYVVKGKFWGIVFMEEILRNLVRSNYEQVFERNDLDVNDFHITLLPHKYGHAGLDIVVDIRYYKQNLEGPIHTELYNFKFTPLQTI